MSLPKDKKEQLLELDNVVGVGMGEDGKVKVFVKEKKPEDMLETMQVVPASMQVDGEEVGCDVEETGEIRALSATIESQPDGDRDEVHRPAPAGVSVSHEDVSAGTLGTTQLVCDEINIRDDKVLFLTNAHVAAPPENSQPGDLVLQPGNADGGTRANTIGQLVDGVEISRDEPNTTDSALVAVKKKYLSETEIYEMGELAGLIERIGRGEADKFHKSGRTTGVTTGRRIAQDVEIQVQGMYPDEATTFDGVDAFEPMSAGGDSGSIIGVWQDGQFYGTHLLFAGSPFQTFGIPLEQVFAEHGRLQVANPGKESSEPEQSRILSIIRSVMNAFF